MNNPQKMANQQSSASISAIHHTLRSARRRLVLVFLMQQLRDQDTVAEWHRPTEDVDVSVRKTARYIGAVEQNIPIDSVQGDEYHNIYSSLIQSNLPRLHAIDAIQYDDDRKLICPGSNLLPLTAILTTTTPLANLLFVPGDADLYTAGGHDIGLPD